MSEHDWKALARIASTPDGQHLLTLLRRLREECRDKLEMADNPLGTGRLQGHAEAFKSLAEQLENAREVIEKRFTHN